MTDERRYTLEAAAAKIGFRANDLVTLLLDVGIDTAPPGYEENTLSEAESAWQTLPGRLCPADSAWLNAFSSTTTACPTLNTHKKT